MRLPRERKGKTPIDVTIVEQDDTVRVRLTMGEDGGSKKNSDLTATEVKDLTTLLDYHGKLITGELGQEKDDGG